MRGEREGEQYGLRGRGEQKHGKGKDNDKVAEEL